MLGSKQITGSADLQVPHGDFESRSEFREFADGGKPFFRHFLQDLVLPVHEKCRRRPVRAAYTPAQLVQLRQPHFVRVMDNDRIDISYIEARFYDSRRDQNVNGSVDEIHHDLFQFIFIHLPVRKGYLRLRNKVHDAARHIRDVLHPVVHIVHLTTPGQFPADRLPHQFLVKFHDVSLDRNTLLRRFLQDRHVPYADQAHMKGPRNRSGCQCQHVHILPKLLDLLFMGNAKALLLIDHQEAQIPETHIL